MTTAAPPSSGPFSSRAVGLMLLVGVVAFIGLVAAVAYGPSPGEDRQGGPHALSRSAVGFAGLVQLLKATGVPVVVSRGTPPGLGRQDQGVLVLTPGAGASPEELLEARAGRRALIVLPKWAPAPNPRRPGWVYNGGPVPGGMVTAFLKPARQVSWYGAATTPKLTGQGPFAGRTLQLGRIERLQSMAGPGRVALQDGRGRPILIAIDPTTYVLTDPDIFNDQGLRSLDTARAALAILEGLRDGGPVTFDVTLHGFKRSRSLLRLALEPPFVGATLCALAAALLMGAHAAVRFGPARRPERAFALGKRALADNAAVLIGLARREARMGGRYAAMVRRAVAKSVGVDRAPSPAHEAAALDRLTRPDEPSFSTLAADLEGARDEAQLMHAARRLHQRRLEMTRERF